MNLRLRRFLLMLLPPIGGALGALALIDFAAYGRFVWATVGVMPRAWWVFDPSAGPTSVLWIAGCAAFVVGWGFLLGRRVTAGWLVTGFALAIHLLAATLSRAAALDPSIEVCECFSHCRGYSELYQLLFVAHQGLAVTGVALAISALLGARLRPAEWTLAIVAAAAMVGLSLVWQVDESGWFQVAGPFARASLEADHVYAAARVAVMMVAIGLIGLRLWRGWQVRTRGGLLACCLGAAAFAGTRDLAHDAGHVLPVFDWEPMRSSDVVTPALRCDPDDHALSPSIMGSLERFSISGRIVGAPGTAALEGLALETLVDMRKQYEDLHSYARDIEPMSNIDLQFHKDLRMIDVIPLIRAAHEAGYVSTHVLSEKKWSIDSRTRGTLVRYARCTRAFAIDPTGTPADQFETWGDLAEALNHGEVRLALPE